MTTSARSLQELLNASTYQDMTDEEIDMIIDYKTTQAASTAVNTEIMQRNTADRQTRLAHLQASSAQALSMLESIVNAELPLQSVVIVNE